MLRNGTRERIGGRTATSPASRSPLSRTAHLAAFRRRRLQAGFYSRGRMRRRNVPKARGVPRECVLLDESA